jgi:hypothetical protein
MTGLRPSLFRLASLAVSATVTVTLWEGAKTLWSRERRRRDPPIVEGRSAALVGAMNGGWVTLLAQSDDRPLARGRLMLRRAPPRASSAVFWEGESRPLHLETDAGELTSGPYRVQLAESGDPTDSYQRREAEQRS